MVIVKVETNQGIIEIDESKVLSDELGTYIVLPNGGTSDAEIIK